MTEIRNMRTGGVAKVPQSLAEVLVKTGKFDYPTRAMSSSTAEADVAPKTRRKYKRRDLRAEG